MALVTSVAAIYQDEPFFLLQKSPDNKKKNKITHLRAQDVPYWRPCAADDHAAGVRGSLSSCSTW